MTAPRHTLRVLFAFSCLACSAIGVLFVRGRATPTATFWWELAAMAVVVTAGLCLLVFRRGGLLLPDTAWGPLVRTLLWHLMGAYVGCTLLVTAVSLAVLLAVTRASGSALALAVLAGLWLSLWLAPGVAALTTARALKRLAALPAGTGA